MYILEMRLAGLLIRMALNQRRVLQDVPQGHQPRGPRVHVLIGQSLP